MLSIYKHPTLINELRSPENSCGKILGTYIEIQVENLSTLFDVRSSNING